MGAELMPDPNYLTDSIFIYLVKFMVNIPPQDNYEVQII